MKISLCSLCKAGTMKMLYIRENISSHRRENLLFLSCNMAAAQNRYQASNASDQILDFVKNISSSELHWSVLENLDRPLCVWSVPTTSVKINLLLTEREGRTGEYWPEVMAKRKRANISRYG